MASRLLAKKLFSCDNKQSYLLPYDRNLKKISQWKWLHMVVFRHLLCLGDGTKLTLFFGVSLFFLYRYILSFFLFLCIFWSNNMLSVIKEICYSVPIFTPGKRYFMGYKLYYGSLHLSTTHERKCLS